MYPYTNKSQLFLCITASLFVMLSAYPANAIAKTDFQIAQQHLEKGRITEARRALQAELRVNPHNIEARYDLAVLLEDIDHHSDALSLYKKNMSLSWHLPSLVNLAALLERQEQTDQARQWLKRGTKKLRHEAAPWYLLAAMAEQQGNITTALAQHRHAIKADPLNGFAWLRFADFQSRRQLADRGIRYAEKAMRLLPNCAPCWRSYGNIMQKKDLRKKALIAYQRSLSIHPDNRTRQQLIILLRKLGQINRAKRMQQALDAWRKHQQK